MRGGGLGEGGRMEAYTRWGELLFITALRKREKVLGKKRGSRGKARVVAKYPLRTKIIPHKESNGGRGRKGVWVFQE